MEICESVAYTSSLLYNSSNSFIVNIIKGCEFNDWVRRGKSNIKRIWKEIKWNEGVSLTLKRKR